MRCENIVSKHLVKMPVGIPDGNGHVYSKESINNSLYTILNTPFGAYVDGKFVVFGIVTDWAYVDESDDYMEIEVTTQAFHGGTVSDDMSTHISDSVMIRRRSNGIHRLRRSAES